MCTCIHVYSCIYIDISVYSYYVLAYKFMNIHMCTCVHDGMCACDHICACVFACVYWYMHIFMDRCMLSGTS